VLCHRIGETVKDYGSHLDQGFSNYGTGRKTNWLDKASTKVFANFTRKLKVGLQ